MTGRRHINVTALLALAAVVLASPSPGLALTPGRADEAACCPAVRVSEPRWVIPSMSLPPRVKTQAANDNVSLAIHRGRLFIAWRTAPSHFASDRTRLYVMSSGDGGRSWQFELDVHMKTDMREPHLLSFRGRLIFTFFEAGKNPFAFEPRRMWRTVRLGPARWSPLEAWGEEGEVPWAFQVHKGRVYLTTYLGEHYGSGVVDVRFFVSDDGLQWEPVSGGDPVVYTGGVSEVGFAFDPEGNLWGVTRNEDGDGTGFGSHVVTAPACDLAAWRFPARSDPYRYDSPRLFRHGTDIYMVARRDPCSPYDLGFDFLPFSLRKVIYLVSYSLRPKRTALYLVDRVARKVKWVLDLPSAADTAFPSVVQTGPHRYLVANYTSPLSFADRSWLEGQISPQGTSIYLIDIEFGAGL